MTQESATRKPGRPRAIPPALIPIVISMYEAGLGYRAISRELGKYGMSADWSTVRRAIKACKPSPAGKE